MCVADLNCLQASSGCAMTTVAMLPRTGKVSVRVRVRVRVRARRVRVRVKVRVRVPVAP